MTYLPRWGRNPDNPSTSLTYVVPPRPDDVDATDTEMAFTAEALQTLLRTVGSRLPETGAKLFGPIAGLGIDIVEFDVHGSEGASGAVYSPDAEWGGDRQHHWIHQPGSAQRIWTGDAHSHPGGVGRPSPKVGPGLGDLGYVELFFGQNEAQREFFLPILTNTKPGDSVVTVNPWMAKRENPSEGLWAPFAVRSAQGFAPRLFDPAFEAAVATATTPQGLALALDLDLLAHQLHAHFGRHLLILGPDEQGAVEIDAGDAVIRLHADANSGAMTATILRGAIEGLTAGTTSGSTITSNEDQATSLIATTLAADKTRAPRPPAPEPAITREDYFARVDTLLTDKFHESTIVVVGVSGGTHLIEKLARLGPSKITLVDHDAVEVPNLVRTAFHVDQIGMSKPAAMADLVRAANPFVDVETRDTNITTLTVDEVRELLDGVDLIVAGTDSFEAQATMNRWSQMAAIPAVFIGVHEGAAGGIVRWSIPGETACFRCSAVGRYKTVTQGGTVDLPGEPGLLIDVQAIDMVAASVIVGLLDRGAPTPKGQLIDHLGDRCQIVVTTTPSYEWGQALFSSLVSDLPTPTSREADLATYLGVLPIITLPTTPVPDCPDCALFHQDPPANGLGADDSVTGSGSESGTTDQEGR